MGRPPLPLGTWGNIRRTQLGPKWWMADTLFRDFDGQTRRVERRGASAAKAETALKEYLLTRSRAGRVGEVTPETAFGMWAHSGWLRSAKKAAP